MTIDTKELRCLRAAFQQEFFFDLLDEIDRLHKQICLLQDENSCLKDGIFRKNIVINEALLTSKAK